MLIYYILKIRKKGGILRTVNVYLRFGGGRKESKLFYQRKQQIYKLIEREVNIVVKQLV